MDSISENAGSIDKKLPKLQKLLSFFKFWFFFKDRVFVTFKFFCMEFNDISKQITQFAF